MASFSSSSSKERVEMASVSRHGKVKAVQVDLEEEYRPDEEPLLAEVPINDFMRNQRPTKKRSPMHRPTILHQAEQRKAHVIDSEPAAPTHVEPTRADDCEEPAAPTHVEPTRADDCEEPAAPTHVEPTRADDCEEPAALTHMEPTQKPACVKASVC